MSKFKLDPILHLLLKSCYFATTRPPIDLQEHQKTTNKPLVLGRSKLQKMSQEQSFQIRHQTLAFSKSPLLSIKELEHISRLVHTCEINDIRNQSKQQISICLFHQIMAICAAFKISLDIALLCALQPLSN